MTTDYHYWNLVDLMLYSFVYFVTFLISNERKCQICDIIVLNKLTLTQSERISAWTESRTYFSLTPLSFLE